MTGSRTSSVDVAPDGEGLIGVVGQGTVQKNQQEPMVQISNNAAAQVTVTVTLVTATDGTLYDNEGGSGSSVSFTLPSGSSQYVDIEATVEGFIDYTVSVSSSTLNLDTTGTVESVGGNANAFVRVQKVQEFVADSSADNEWTLGQVKVEDRDGDADLDRVEYEIADSDGTTRATRTDPAAGAQYDASDLTFVPDDPSYDMPEGEVFRLSVKGYDVDGNFDTETIEDTSEGANNDPTALEIKKIQNFQSNTGTNDWTIDQVQVQDRDGDDDLDHLDYVVTDSGGTVRGTRTDAMSGGQFQDNNGLTIPPDAGYTLVSGETYTVEATAYDADGNFTSVTRQDTA